MLCYQPKASNITSRRECEYFCMRQDMASISSVRQLLLTRSMSPCGNHASWILRAVPSNRVRSLTTIECTSGPPDQPLRVEFGSQIDSAIFPPLEAA
jgi:hypothetical protein